jgi:hypothetical protein
MKIDENGQNNSGIQCRVNLGRHATSAVNSIRWDKRVAGKLKIFTRK